MLSQLRQNTKTILWVVIVAFVGMIFALWGMNLRRSGGVEAGFVGRVAGDRITVDEYRNEVANQRQVYYQDQDRRPGVYAEKEIADMLSGIQQDGAAAELASLRETRQQLRSEARVSKRLAGTDMGRERAKLRAAARKRVSNRAFMDAIGVSKEVEEAAPAEAEAAKDEPEQESNLPE